MSHDELQGMATLCILGFWGSFIMLVVSAIGLFSETDDKDDL